MTLLLAQLLTLVLFRILDLELSSGFLLIQLLISCVAAFFYLRFFYWRYEISLGEIEVTYPYNSNRGFVIQDKDILSATLSQASRSDPGLKIKSKGKTVSLPISISLFKLAELLKAYHNKGIEINFDPKDHELEMYVEGKIESLPMTNDMK